MQDERFRRLLRWYPRAWRERNGEVLLGTMLDEAERHGRTTPTMAERFSVIVYGVGTRLDGQLSVWSALAALAVSAVAGIVTIWGITPLSAARAGWVLPVLTVAVCPGLVVVGAVSLARQRALVSEPRALVVVALALSALSVAACAQLSWGMGFDAADRGVTLTGFATAWPWLFGTAWVLGATAVAVFVDPLLRRFRPHPVVCTVLAAVAGAALAPAIGVTVVSPYVSAIGAAGLALFTLGLGRAGRLSAQTTVPTPVPNARVATADVPLRTRSLARVLACVTVLGSAVGIAYALTGARWSSGSADETAVMGEGITIALASALPLLGGIGVLLAARARRHPGATWGPLILVALSLAAVAVAYVNAPGWAGMVAGFAVASAFGGSAIVWWIIPRLRGPARIRVAVGVLIGVGYAALLGMLVVPMLAFALPLLATWFAIWAPRSPRPSKRSPHAQAGSRTNPSTLRHEIDGALSN